MQKFIDLIELIRRLRAPGGCPWDQKQTPATFKPYIIEEAHELAEAIDHNDPTHVREELGDLLFQAAFLNLLYEEEGHFGMEEVLTGIIDKMIRRHPHVFGDSTATSETALRQQWNAIKALENAGKGSPAEESQDGGLATPPATLPALRRAQKVSESAAQRGFEWPDTDSVFAKLEEELAECRQAVAQGSRKAILEEIGDLLFVLVNLGRLTGTNTEEALQAATAKFTDRFNAMAGILAAAGREFSDLEPAAQLALWRQCKGGDTPPPQAEAAIGPKKV